MLAEKALNEIIAKATPKQRVELEKADKRERIKKCLAVGGILLALAIIIIFFVNRAQEHQKAMGTKRVMPMTLSR